MRRLLTAALVGLLAVAGLAGCHWRPVAAGASTSSSDRASQASATVTPGTATAAPTPTRTVAPTPSSTPTVASTVVATLHPTPTAASSPGPTVAAQPFWADSYQQTELSQVATTAADRALLSVIFDEPMAIWLTGDQWDVTTVTRFTSQAAAAGRTAVVVLYDIPGRDCGQYSAGGAADDTYLAWVRQMVAAMTGHVWVILEPDALAQAGCNGTDASARYRLLHDAGVLLRQAGHRVYLDAGNAVWLTPDDVAARLRAVGADAFDGLSLNVSNFETTAVTRAYAASVAAAWGSPLHYVVDTSRNGNGPTADHAWCNPPGRALGEVPHLGSGTFDAALWVKQPGGSDGACNGAPASGQYWVAYGEELVRNRHW